MKPSVTGSGGIASGSAANGSVVTTGGIVRRVTGGIERANSKAEKLNFATPNCNSHASAIVQWNPT